MDAGREARQGLVDLAGLLLVVIATGGVCCQPRGWSSRMENRGYIFLGSKGGILNRGREGEVESLETRMETAEG